MVNHTCNRCGYTTIRKQNLKTHLFKKNTCQTIIGMISIYDTLKSHGFDEEATKYELTHTVNKNNQHKLTKINKNNQQKSTKINKNSTENKISAICKFCSKKLSCYKSCNRHEKTCKEKNNIEQQVNDELSINKNIIEQNKILKENNDKLTLQVELLLKNASLTNTNISNKNKTNNKTNNINKGTVNNNTIINNYGSENIDYITFNRFVKLLETPLSAISKLIELKYFNEKHPENHNIKITNIHDKFAKIYKDKKWLVSNKKDIIQELVENGYADFEEFKDLNEEELTNKIKERYGKMEKYYTENLGELYKQSEMSIINGTNKLE